MDTATWITHVSLVETAHPSRRDTALLECRENAPSEGFVKNYLESLGHRPSRDYTLSEVDDWLMAVESVVRAVRVLEHPALAGLRNIRDVMQTWLDALDHPSTEQNDWMLCLHAGKAAWRMVETGCRQPWTLVLKRHAKLGRAALANDPRRTIRAWFDGRLHPEDTQWLAVQCAEKIAPWSPIYRKALREMSHEVTVVQYPVDVWRQAARDDRPVPDVPPLLSVPLPHLGADHGVFVYAHVRGALWVVPGELPHLIESGTQSFEWGDATTGPMETRFEWVVPEPDETRRYMADVAAVLRNSNIGPHEEAVACGLARLLPEYFGDAISEGARAFRTGEDPDDKLVGVVLDAYAIRVALEHIGATALSVQLATEIVDADERLSNLGAGEAVLLLDDWTVLDHTSGLPLDPDAWWDRPRVLRQLCPDDSCPISHLKPTR